MFLETINVLNAEPATECPIRKDLTLLAAGLDTRFLRAGTALGTAVEAITRVIGGLEGVIAALDDRIAGAAVADLRHVASELTNLPTRQADRARDMATVGGIARALNDHVHDMHETLRVLMIYGINIKIAASGEDQFVGFVDGMTARLTVGEEELRGFITQLKVLLTAIASVQQADRLLAVESGKILPRIPERLNDDAAELAVYLTRVATLARGVAGIAVDVQQKVAVVLCALQVGDRTRQRLEHVASALQIVDTHGDRQPLDAATSWHLNQLFAAQLEAVSTDFTEEAGAMLESLTGIAPDIAKLRAMIVEQGTGDGRTFLTRLEHGITDVERVTTRLRDAERHSATMVATITDTVAELTRRLVSVQRIRLQVQDMATNTRLLCRRHGTTGKAVSVIATEVDANASYLGAITANVAKAISDLSAIEGSLCADSGGAVARDMGDTLADALRIVRHACQRTEESTMAGGDDAQALADLLRSTGADLDKELSLTTVIQDLASALTHRAPASPMTEIAVGELAILLPEIGRLYTMVQERVVHDRYLLPGMASTILEAADDDDDDDGLF